MRFDLAAFAGHSCLVHLLDEYAFDEYAILTRQRSRSTLSQRLVINPSYQKRNTAGRRGMLAICIL